MDEFYHFVVSALVDGERRWAYVTNDRRECDFHSLRSVNSILTRKMALKALDRAANKDLAEVRVERVEVTSELCSDQIRQLRREQIIEDKQLTVEEVELIRWTRSPIEASAA